MPKLANVPPHAAPAARTANERPAAVAQFEIHYTQLLGVDGEPVAELPGFAADPEELQAWLEHNYQANSRVQGQLMGELAARSTHQPMPEQAPGGAMQMPPGAESDPSGRAPTMPSDGLRIVSIAARCSAICGNVGMSA